MLLAGIGESDCTYGVQSYNEKSDVYSFGVILWELFMSQEPWQDKNAMQVRPCASSPEHAAASLPSAPPQQCFIPSGLRKKVP